MSSIFKPVFAAIIAGTVLLFFLFSISIVITAKADTPAILEKTYSSGKIKIKFEDLSRQQIEILLKVEDPDFYNHKGIDLKTPGAGITTITQGAVKKLYFKNFKPGLLKFKQTLIAGYVLDKLLSKEKQIELYINLLYFGSNAYGMHDAAHKHFKKDFQDLSTDEYIALVAMIIAPATFDISKFPERNKDRVNAIKAYLSGNYTPKGLMDLYYGGNTYRKKSTPFITKLNNLVWGY